jgi:hypothetical protein
MKELPAINLDGFEPPFGCFEYTWGPPVDHDGTHWQDHQYHAEVLAWYYHDYLGTHAFIQVWDYAQQSDPDQRWQYLLVLHRPGRHVNSEGVIVHTEWAWTIRNEYEDLWIDGGPGHAKVAADVDLWLKTPEYLRFVLE